MPPIGEGNLNIFSLYEFNSLGNFTPINASVQQSNILQDRNEPIIKSFLKRNGEVAGLKHNVRGKKWEQIKKPQIFSNEDDAKSILINGVDYTIVEMGAGSFHTVYRFLSDKKLIINKEEIPLNEVILRTIKTTTNLTDLNRVYDGDVKAVEYLEKLGVPIPKIYVRPDTFVDTQDRKNGGFWIVEKMSTEVKATDKDALQFAKNWFTRSFNEKKELINDLTPRNLMRRGDGTLCIVDFALPDSDKDYFEFNLIGYLIEWSQGNKERLEWILSEIPQADKERLIANVLSSIEQAKLNS